MTHSLRRLLSSTALQQMKITVRSYINLLDNSRMFDNFNWNTSTLQRTLK